MTRRPIGKWEDIDFRKEYHEKTASEGVVLLLSVNQYLQDFFLPVAGYCSSVQPMSAKASYKYWRLFWEW